MTAAQYRCAFEKCLAAYEVLNDASHPCAETMWEWAMTYLLWAEEAETSEVLRKLAA